MSDTIIFATHNPHKAKEVKSILGPGVTILTLEDVGFSDDIAETGSSFEENALIKAKHVYDRYSVPVMAEDSGLVVDALDGRPGIYSARYAGDDKDDRKNLALVLQQLGEEENRSAYFISVIALTTAHGDHLFTGTIHGNIADKPMGTDGFGYDPIFIPEGYDLTFAQLGSEIKDKISHRYSALLELQKAFDQKRIKL